MSVNEDNTQKQKGGNLINEQEKCWTNFVNCTQTFFKTEKRLAIDQGQFHKAQTPKFVLQNIYWVFMVQFHESLNAKIFTTFSQKLMVFSKLYCIIRIWL